MRILYGIQGTGHGHISRAREILPLLINHAEVDVLLSGYNCNMSLEDIHIMKRRGISLSYSDNGRVSLFNTIKKLKPITFLRDVNKLDSRPYDLVISDFEPISAWASYKTGIPSLALSHQASFLSDLSPRPDRQSLFSEQILKNFAPCKSALGFHFRRYDHFIEPPIIRSEVLSLKPQKDNHVTVYLPAFHHRKLIPYFRKVSSADWHIFSPSCTAAFDESNVTVHPVDNIAFLKSLENCIGVLTSGGFETCAEAMYLGKKLMVIPIKNQYEQLCNAAALKEKGIHVHYSVTEQFSDSLDEWLHSAHIRRLTEITDTQTLCKTILSQADMVRKSAHQFKAPPV